ncbi:MAG: hypothetical protein AAB425_13640 [Bdellovibrionota bacterium]
MKIVLLNPNVDFDSPMVQSLETNGHVVFPASTNADAWTILQLQALNVDAVLIHREGRGGKGAPGLDLISQLKQNPIYSDIPILITSEAWQESDFERHQAGAFGVNRYLKWPIADDLLQAALTGMAPSETAEDVSVSGPPPDLSASIPTVGGPPAFEMTHGTFRVDLGEPSQMSSPMLGDSFSIGESTELDGATTVQNQVPEPPTPPPQDHPRGLTGDEGLLNRIQEMDPIAEAAMPYLFGRQEAEDALRFVRGAIEPVGDAVVPGGASEAPDLEVLKKYLLLREQDVGVLSVQLKEARERAEQLDGTLAVERGRSGELEHMVGEQGKRLQEFDRQKGEDLEKLQTEINDLRFQMTTKTERARQLEAQVREASEEMEKLKERVRTDIRKIRVREKELENRVEMLKKDSEALLLARENKIIELKRRIDLIEFNLEVVQNQYEREKDGATRLRDKLARAAQVMRTAEGVLDSNTNGNSRRESEDGQAAEGASSSSELIRRDQAS